MKKKTLTEKLIKSIIKSKPAKHTVFLLIAIIILLVMQYYSMVMLFIIILILHLVACDMF